MIVETTSRVVLTLANRNGQAARDLAELRAALARTPREVPSRFFYDDRGSHLFERICELPEYYQTRTEHALLAAIADQVVGLSGADELVEIGSGSALKTRTLLDAMQRAGRLRRYVPVDVAEGTIRRAADELAAEYPELTVHGIVGDFTADLGRLPVGAALMPRRHASELESARRLIIFLGGTIGNLRPADAHDFLCRRAREMAPGDHFLLGVDLVKPTARLEAAYNDSAGVTAAFNRNILRVVNRLVGGNFDPAAFDHRAFYDPATRWIEMRLVASRPQRVLLPGLDLDLDLAAGEEILTEISAKYDRPETERMLAAAGLTPREWFTDPERLFGLALAVRG